MCYRPKPDLAQTIAAFLTDRRLVDEAAKSRAIIARIPSVTFAEVVQAEAIALEVVKTRKTEDTTPTPSGPSPRLS